MAKSVMVYSTPTCPFCVRVKKYLKDNNIEFKDIDVSSDDAMVEEMIRKSGQMGVPVIDVDGEVVVGFDKDKIAGLLGIN